MSRRCLPSPTKGILIPLFLRRIVRQMRITHEHPAPFSNALSLAVSSLLVAVVYASLKTGITVTGFSRNVLQIAIAVILISLFIMITRKKALVMVMGLLFMENGLFLAGFSLTFGMPTIIELGRAVRHADGRDHSRHLRGADQDGPLPRPIWTS